MYDAIVVGARCAGASTAMLLARRGHRVLLVDRAKFPSDIPHGHAIHMGGPARLARWGLLDPWGSETQIRSRGESVVLVDQAAKKVTSANIPRTHSHRDLVLRQGCRERERAMGAAAVVVFGICPKRPIEMPPTQDQRPVGALGPDSLYHPLGIGVGIGGPDRSRDDPCSLRAEDLVEGTDELGVPVADEEPDGGRAIIELHR